MPKVTKIKKKVTITLDIDLVKRIRRSNIKASTLINTLLLRHFSTSQISESESAHNPEVGSSNLPSAISIETRDLRVENSRTINSDFKNINLHRLFKSDISNKFDLISVKSMYFMYFENYKIWFEKLNLSKEYKLNIQNSIQNIFSQNFRSILELKEIVNTEPNIKYKQLAIRNWIKFIEEYEIIPYETILEWKSKIKINQKSNIDPFIPSKRNILDLSNKIKEYDFMSFIIYNIFIESGLRIKEVSLFIRSLNPSKFEIRNDIVIYPLFYIRGTKSSYYVFISLKTHNLIMENLDNLKNYNIEKLKTWIKRNNQIPLKYTRKYHFTLLIRSGISLEIANFIQGRISQNIGFNHYLAKKEIAIKEYEKINFI